MFKKSVSTLLAILLLLTLCIGCGQNEPTPSSAPDVIASTSSTTASTTTATNDATTTIEKSTAASSATTTVPSATEKKTTVKTSATKTTTRPTTKTTVSGPAKLNGVVLSEYTIVYSENALGYTVRAAQYIRDQIKSRVGIELELVTDAEKASAHEIVVGETNRPISQALEAENKSVNFALRAEGGAVAMEGEFFVIAAAAYYFVDTYITGKSFSASVPTTTKHCQPITKTPKNFIMLIGDGMGKSQIDLFTQFSAAELTPYSDHETYFYGLMLPAHGNARTNSLSGLTDSAAAGTALSTGYKTLNGRVGRNSGNKDLTSLTEIAGSLGMATAVMSTEAQTGATPAAFSAHAADRNDTNDILTSQISLQKKYGTIINCDFDKYSESGVQSIKNKINNTLATLSKNSKGFFLMYEEAYIDKHCHNNVIRNTFRAVVRFNQAIATFMEFAFYHPDTFLLITADHETGGMKMVEGNGYQYTTSNHTTQDVPVFAYGEGSGLFHNKTIENVQIPKTISAFWGKEIVDPSLLKYPALK